MRCAPQRLWSPDQTTLDCWRHWDCTKSPVVSRASCRAVGWVQKTLATLVRSVPRQWHQKPSRRVPTNRSWSSSRLWRRSPTRSCPGNRKPDLRDRERVRATPRGTNVVGTCVGLLIHCCLQCLKRQCEEKKKSVAKNDHLRTIYSQINRVDTGRIGQHCKGSVATKKIIVSTKNQTARDVFFFFVVSTRANLVTKDIEHP